MPSSARNHETARSRTRLARWACCAGGGAVLLTSLLAGSSSASTTATTLKPSADSWVDATQPTVNRGTAGYLQVDASPVLRGYVRFDVTVPSTATLSRAVLSLTPNQSSSDGIIVRTASNAWTETGLTFRNAPAPSTARSVRSGALTAGATAQIDVTSLLPATGGTATFVLENPAGRSFSVRSRERSAGGPSLQVTTSPVTTTVQPVTAVPVTSPTTTPTTSPTTSPTTPPTTTTPSTSAKLTWAPPVLSNPVTYRVSGMSTGVLKAAAGQDSIVVFDGPVNRRLTLSGGRHWIVRGGEINNDRTMPDWNDQSGLQFDGVQGTAFVEGMLIHGKWGTDGIRASSSGNTTLIVQNSRIVDRVSHDGFHADVIQPYGGIKALKVDRLTGAGNYQGQMWKQEPGKTFGPTDFRRVNFRKTAYSSQSMFNFVTSAPTQPVTLADVYHEPYGIDFCRSHFPSRYAACATDSTGRKYVTFSGMSITVNGRINQGLPPGGDFVPASAAGLGYVSPGYL